MTTSSAVTLFRALDTDNSGKLSAAEVTPTWACASGKTTPVADLVGLNQDQFLGVIGQKKIPQATLDTDARLINEGSAITPTVGARVGNFVGGVAFFLVGVIFSPFELIANIVLLAIGSSAPSDAWGLFPAGVDLFSEAFQKGHPYNAQEVTNVTTMFLQSPGVGNDPSCVE